MSLNTGCRIWTVEASTECGRQNQYRVLTEQTKTNYGVCKQAEDINCAKQVQSWTYKQTEHVLCKRKHSMCNKHKIWTVQTNAEY